MKFSWLGLTTNLVTKSGLQEIFPLRLRMVDFVDADILATYTKILTDTIERTYGIEPKYDHLLWDNCVQDATTHGLISLLADAMAYKREIFLVYVPSSNIVRKATSEEEQRIREDYKKQATSSVGVYISFKHYRRSDMLRIYSELEYCAISSLHKNMNIARAVQLKMAKLRESVALTDVEIVRNQAASIADALRQGEDVYMDKDDDVTTATPDSAPAEKAISFLDAKRAFFLGTPLAYISGLQTGGIGATGEADTKAIERGLKQYFRSIIYPTLKALFGLETEFKSQDFREVTTALEVMKTFDLVSNEYISREAKTEIVRRMWNLNEKEETRALKDEESAREEAPPVNGGV